MSRVLTYEKYDCNDTRTPVPKSEDNLLSNVHDNGKQFIKSIWILCVIHRIEETELQRECDTVCKLDVLPYILLVFETFEMKRKHIR